MIYGIKEVVTCLLGTDIAGRKFAVYPDDTLLVSYPRSGNTLTRFANLLHPDVEVSFANIERLIPDSASQSSRVLKRTPRRALHRLFQHLFVTATQKIRAFAAREPTATFSP
jgi:hypothetical protein